MKKVVQVVFLVMCLFGMFLVVCVVPSSNVSANDPNPMGGGLYITAGDWIVDGTSTLKTFTAGDTVVVNGNLTVQAPQTLSFTGANLQMNPSYDGQYRITVESGANIIIQDVDGNSMTTGDRSMVNSSNPAFRYEFVVEGPNGQIIMTNSELRDCGWEENAANSWQSSGLWIGTDNLLDAAEISGNEIHEGVIGVTIFQSTVGADISDNYIHDCSFTGIEINQSIGVVVDNNILTTCGNGVDYSHAIHGWIGTNNDFINNEIVDHQFFGMFLLAQSGVLVDGNTIRDTPGAGAGLIVYGMGGDNFITFNEVYNITWSGIFVDGLNSGANAYVSNNTVHDISVTDGTVAINQQNLDLGHLESCDNTIYNIDESVDFGYKNVGMIVHGGSGHLVARNDISTVSDFGVQIYADDVLFMDNDIYGNGDGVASFFGDDAGVLIMADNTVVKDSRIYDNHPPFVPGSSDVNGIFIALSSNTYIKDSDISNNEINVGGQGDGITSNDALIENCTITKGIWTNYDFQLEQNSDFTTLNSTFDNSSAYIIDAADSLTCKWYLHVKVVYMGSGVNGAEVWINNSMGNPDPSTGQPFITETNGGEPGWIRWLTVTEFLKTSSTMTYYTPHAANATSGNLKGSAFPNVWRSKEKIIYLENRPEILNFQFHGGASSVYRDSSIFLHINASDIEDAEDVLVIYVEYRVSDASPWETTNFTGPLTYIGSVPSGYWEITFLPDSASPLGFYDFRVRVEDTYPTSSDWWVENDLLEVQNNPPTVEATSNTSASVLRGNPIFVIVDGDDIEDIENALACEIQYRAPSGSWSGPDTTINAPYFDGSDWRAQFTPQTSPTKDEIGLYDFRFRFQDTDGDWSAWEERFDWIEVLNNPPQADDLDTGQTMVYRNAQGSQNNYVWLFANVTELEDPENQLTVLFEYYEPGVGWGTTYIDDIFSQSYDAFAGLWKVKFIPPDTAEVGFYNFRVTFTDLDGDSDTETVNGLVQVMNNPPDAIDMIPSDTSITAGVPDLLHIQVNAADIEDAESELTIGDIEWQYQGSSTWSGTWFGDVGYDPTGGGHVWVEFEPPSSATPGLYSFRVKVMDQDGDMSSPWLVIYDAVEVLSSQPEIEYVTPEANEIFRGDQLIIRMSGSDAVDPEDQLIPHLEYRKKAGGSWSEISGTSSYNSGGGYWEVYWTPDIALNLGTYEFQGRFENTDGAFSDYMAGDFDVTVKNNLPLALDLGIVGAGAYVYRGDSITLYANGDDVETPENQLTVYFEYRAPGGAWDNAYLSGKTYSAIDSRWEVDFESDLDAILGDYDFRAYFRDADNDNSDALEEIALVEVVNVKPTVEDLIVTPSTANRTESVTIISNGADGDGSEAALIPTFQYRPPSGGWTDVPGFPNYIGTNWRIIWTSNVSDELGMYSFRVRYNDSVDFSEWMEETDALILLNNLPVVMDITPSPISMRAGAVEPIYLIVNGSDVEDLESELTIVDIEWQYCGSSGGLPSGSWSALWFGTSTWDAGGGYFKVPWQPPSGATSGYYGFRVKLTDPDGSDSDPWTEILDAVYVATPEPDIEYVTPEVDEVFRGDQMTIRMKGSDAIDSQDQLVPYLEYKKKGTSTWTEISGSTSYNSGGGYWEVYWIPNATLDPGQYEFQGRFENTDNAFSDYEAGNPDVTVKNNIPTAINIGIVGSMTSVDREDSITLYANGDDVETSENLLNVYFEYSAPGDTWDTTYFAGKTHNDVDNRWEINFSPDGDADLGDYSFKIYFKDTDNNNSDPVVMSSTITVNNVKPIVEDLIVPLSAFRGESITITANGTDADGSEGALSPTFEYKSPSGTWTPIPGSANYLGTSFRITWTPGANEDVGQYSFRVKFIDDVDDSDWMEQTGFTLKNNPPSADGITVPDSSYRLDTITITASGSDVEEAESSLVPQFQYRGPDGIWTSVGDTDSYFTGNAQFSNGLWQIGFKAPSGAELGQYSFRVQFSDGVENSDWLVGSTSLTLDANPQDPDDDGALNVDDLDDDGDNVPDNDDDFPLDPAASTDTDGDGKPDSWNTGKSFSDSTSYLVIDDDDDDDGVPDLIDPDPLDPTVTGKEEEEEPTWYLSVILLLVIIIILLTLLLMRFSIHRKKKDEIPTTHEDETNIEEELPEDEESGDILKEDESLDGDGIPEGEESLKDEESIPSETDNDSSSEIGS